MSRVLTNATGLAYSIESALGVAGTVWRDLEPNSIGNFGSNITTVAPSPISKNRQRQKGFITDLDSSVDFEADLTLSGMRDFIEGFCFARATNDSVAEMGVTAAAATAKTYTTADFTAAQIAILKAGALLFGRGFTQAANNGLQSVRVAPTSGSGILQVNESLADETGIAAGKAALYFTGYRVPASSTVGWTYTALTKRASLGMSGIGTKIVTMGLTLGQVVHIGSPAGNGFLSASSAAIVGFARVVSITDDAVVFDKLDAALKFTDAAIATAVDILFGQFIRNVPTDDTANYLERSFHFEANYAGLRTGTAVTPYRYSEGNYPNTVGFGLPLSDRATMSLAFIGTDTGNPVVTRLSGAAAALFPKLNKRFNTTSDIARLRITEIDEDGLTTDFKSVTLNISNNVSPEKVVAKLGAKFMNFGNFDVGVEAQVLFTEGAVLTKIRDNETVAMDFVLRGEDGAVIVDIPSMTLGGGNLEFPINETVLLNTTGQAFEDEALGISLGVSLIPSPVS